MVFYSIYSIQFYSRCFFNAHRCILYNSPQCVSPIDIEISDQRSHVQPRWGWYDFAISPPVVPVANHIIALRAILTDLTGGW